MKPRPMVNSPAGITTPGAIPQRQAFAERREQQRGQRIGEQRQSGENAVIAEGRLKIDRQVDLAGGQKLKFSMPDRAKRRGSGKIAGS